MANKTLTLRLDEYELKNLTKIKAALFENTLSKTIKKIINNHINLMQTIKNQESEIEKLKEENLKYKHFGRMLREFVIQTEHD